MEWIKFNKILQKSKFQHPLSSLIHLLTHTTKRTLIPLSQHPSHHSPPNHTCNHKNISRSADPERKKISSRYLGTYTPSPPIKNLHPRMCVKKTFKTHTCYASSRRTTSIRPAHPQETFAGFRTPWSMDAGPRCRRLTCECVRKQNAYGCMCVYISMALSTLCKT